MNKAAQRRVDAFRRVGCIACRLMGHFTEQYDEHHLVDKGTRELSGGDLATIPLCLWHPRGQSPISGVAAATELYGPSLKHNKKLFVERYGSERELLEKVNALLVTIQNLKGTL